jgi:hypothetical protein
MIAPSGEVTPMADGCSAPLIALDHAKNFQRSTGFIVAFQRRDHHEAPYSSDIPWQPPPTFLSMPAFAPTAAAPNERNSTDVTMKVAGDKPRCRRVGLPSRC